jgi:hypothetical protein
MLHYEVIIICLRSHHHRGVSSVEKKSPENHGEGNPEAADRFNTAEQVFVNSARGKKKIEEGTHVSPEEEAKLIEAENLARGRARGQ